MSEILSNEESLSLLEKEGYSQPKPGTWGIATRDFSSGGFWWFKNQESLIDFLTRGLPTIENDTEDIISFDHVNGKYQEQIQSLSSNGYHFSTIVSLFNNHFSSDIELVWIGSFDELTNSTSEFAIFVRQEFHESDQVIDKKEIKDFKEFVGSEVGYLGMFEIKKS